jgi:hypothetical protein
MINKEKNNTLKRNKSCFNKLTKCFDIMDDHQLLINAAIVISIALISFYR